MVKKKSNIGILTFHRTTNFGSFLQTYGLYKKITDLGYNCEIIDYRCPAIEKRECLEHKVNKSLKAIVKYIMLQPALNRKASELIAFSSEHMCFSQPYYPDDIAQSVEKYDKIIVGSDIVWGLDITEGDLNYFLDFVRDKEKKFAFASSVGVEGLENKDILSSLLKDFNRIAVREESAVDWVKEVSGRTAEWVCDPTMLLTKDEWLDVIPVKQEKKEYVLVYYNNSGNKSLSDAITYAKKYNKKVLYINYGFPMKGVMNIKPKTLSEFLSYIFFADHVFTASYHGMLFSVYFEKDFTFYTRNRASRLISLSHKLGLDKQCGDTTNITEYQKPDYWEIDKRVAEFRESSIQVLKEMLEV